MAPIYAPLQAPRRDPQLRSIQRIVDTLLCAFQTLQVLATLSAQN
jgi:hypothetical protein